VGAMLTDNFQDDHVNVTKPAENVINRESASIPHPFFYCSGSFFNISPLDECSITFIHPFDTYGPARFQHALILQK